MKVSGTATLEAAVEEVWRAFMDPDVLARTLPGCEHLEETGENQFAATVTAGVGSIKGSFQGKVQLTDLKAHESLTLHAQAAGATGTIGVEVRVAFTNLGDGTTEIGYDADAAVGGMIGGVGQRMLGSVSKRMAGQFFSNVNRALTGQLPKRPAPAGDPPGPDTQPTAAAPAPGTAPAVPAQSAGSAPGGGAGGRDLLRGAAVGAAIALLGALVGASAPRRR